MGRSANSVMRTSESASATGVPVAALAMPRVRNPKATFSATVAGAEALKGHGATGQLRVGDPADLILLDPLAPNLRPVIDGFGVVAHSASAGNVTDVMVQGAWLIRDRKPTRVNAAEVVAEAQRVAEGLWARAEAG